MTETGGANPGWHSVCAPIGIVQSPGWTMLSGIWDELITNVAKVQLGFDVGTTHTEESGFYNLCLKTLCSPPPCE